LLLSKFGVQQEIRNGIETITYRPAEPSHDTPILFVHGMWHGAWCWRDWQEYFANEGWESHAISLPGHGSSPAMGSVRFLTMGDYLRVVRDVVGRFANPPIVIGHSMGGGLVQWYLKKVADDLPAVVLVASFPSHSTIADGALQHLRRDTYGFLKMALSLSSTPLVRSPKWAASLLITEGAALYPEDLHARLCEESALVLLQHNPPFWTPPRKPTSPMLWIAGERDAAFSYGGARRSASYYGAEFASVPDSGHDLMLEASRFETAEAITEWLSKLS
jgi:pimeloyl-ACP methyl ester carboxylesterase